MKDTAPALTTLPTPEWMQRLSLAEMDRDVVASINTRERSAHASGGVR